MKSALTARACAAALILPLAPALAPQQAHGQEKAPKAPPRPAPASPPQPKKESAPDGLKPTESNVAYGTDPRQVLDFWKAHTRDPAPVLFYIHGGGWYLGDKDTIAGDSLAQYLAAGISVVSINYRMVPAATAAGVKPPVSWPMRDAARALQFVRSKAGEWHLDKTRIAVSGGSAGACTSLWLAFHRDMAEPGSPDPVARESTRPTCAAVMEAQTSLDPRQMREWTPNSVYGGHAFGFPNTPQDDRIQFAAFLAARESILPWIREYSPWELVSSDDPPVFLIYITPPDLGKASKDPTHSANFGAKLQEKLKATGVECVFQFPGANVAPATKEEYVIQKLKPSPPVKQQEVPSQ